MRQALEETSFSIEEAILYTLQLMTSLPDEGFLGKYRGVLKMGVHSCWTLLVDDA